jgi:hypothetical protein
MISGVIIIGFVWCVLAAAVSFVHATKCQAGKRREDFNDAPAVRSRPAASSLRSTQRA